METEMTKIAHIFGVMTNYNEVKVVNQQWQCLAFMFSGEYWNTSSEIDLQFKKSVLWYSMLLSLKQQELNMGFYGPVKSG